MKKVEFNIDLDIVDHNILYSFTDPLIHEYDVSIIKGITSERVLLYLSDLTENLLDTLGWSSPHKYDDETLNKLQAIPETEIKIDGCFSFEFLDKDNKTVDIPYELWDTKLVIKPNMDSYVLVKFVNNQDEWFDFIINENNGLFDPRTMDNDPGIPY